MSDATTSLAAQSASQLSENIGDVLASIRRLIAQDEAAEAAGMVQRMPSDAAEGPRRTDSAARRRDILAEAQALTRRSEAGFGQVAQAALPLTLGAEARVASPDAALPGGRIESVMDGTAGEEARPLVLAKPVADTAAAGSLVALARQREGAAPESTVPEAEAAAADPAITPRHPAPAAGTVTKEGKAMDMSVSETLAPAMTASPAGCPGMEGAPALVLGGAQEGGAAAPLRTAATLPPPAQAAAATAPVVQRAEMPATTAFAPAPLTAPASAPPPITAPAAEPCARRDAPTAPVPAPAGEDAPLAEGEDCTATILRDMIREVVRQELTGDPAGRMAGELRAMILREVAQVLTGSKR